MDQNRLSMENEIVAALRRIMRAVDQHSRHLLDGYGLTGPQLLVLQEAHRSGGIPASALARRAHLSRPTVTGIVDRLEKRGLVRRIPDPKDRRSQRIAVTSAGTRMLEHAPSLLQDRFRRRLGAVEEWERTQILSTLQRIAAMMDAEALAAAPVLVTGPVATETTNSPEDAASPVPSADSLQMTTEPDSEH